MSSIKHSGQQKKKWCKIETRTSAIKEHCLVVTNATTQIRFIYLFFWGGESTTATQMAISKIVNMVQRHRAMTDFLQIWTVN